MIKSATLLWIILAVAVSGALFRVSYRVQHLEKHLAAVNKQIGQEEETARVLQAEWSYLNDPSRLEALARKHLPLGPTSPAQIVTYDAIPSKVPGTAAAQAKNAKPSATPSAPTGHSVMVSLKRSAERKTVDD